MSSGMDGVCPSPSAGAASQAFATALTFFTAAQCLVTENWPEDATISDNETFDFIIVGAGSAGSVIANRLSEVENWNVLLIDAGPDPPVESIIPSMDSTLFSSKYDWNYTTVNDGRTNQGNNNGTCIWPRGRMLGGCSSINGMIYIKGNPNDYQQWYNEGNKEWHPDVLAKYFKKAENLQNYNLRSTPIGNKYGHNGPLSINNFNVSDTNTPNNLLSAWNDIGIKTQNDISALGSVGAGKYIVTANGGERESTAKAYLNSVRERKNLKVIKNSFVIKILINNKTAYGVKVNRNGTEKNYLGSKEIIISAGTINSPQLLMLSGIGPKEHLESFQIKNIANLPVGQNLQDHLVVPVTIYGDDDNVKTQDQASYNFNVIQYLYNRTGTLAQSRILDVTALFGNDGNFSYPLYQNLVIAFPKNSSSVRRHFSKTLNYKDEIVDSIVEINKNHTLFRFLFILLHPASRGNISLQSVDPNVHPLIYPNYLKNNADLTTTVKGIQILTKIVKSTYFKSINGFLGRIKFEKCNALDFGSDQYWECIAINMVVSLYHPIGTCKMGINPESSVVDSRLRVHGIKNLRVADASIMPNESSGNTNGPVIMIGERASDLIKEDYNIE